MNHLSMLNTHPPLDGLLAVEKPGCPDANPLPPHDPSLPLPARPRLWSSHDVVARVRRLSGERRIGHTGTLDPMASGLLLLCLGKATRLVEFYQHQTKRYSAQIRLGGSTDTDDATGTLLSSVPVPPLDSAAIDRALDLFRGEYLQKTPRYSALKQQGETLYQRMRRGAEVDPPSRLVTFYQIDLVNFSPPDRIDLAVECSAGTYLRSLARDLGEQLGTAAYLQSLHRQAIGLFNVAEAHSLARIEAACQQNQLPALLLPLGDRLSMPEYPLDSGTLQRLSFGQITPLTVSLCTPDRQLAAARDEQGRLAGIIRRVGCTDTPIPWLWKAEKWLQ